MLKREEAEKFLLIVKEGIKNGSNLKECFQQAAKELNKTEKTLCTYWYTDDYFEEMREKIRGKTRFHHWNVEKDLEFIKLMNEYIDEGYTIEKALYEIAKKMNKTYTQCKNRWYRHIIKHYDVSFIKRRKFDVINKNASRVITWDEETNKRFLELMDFYFNKGLSITDSLIETSKKLGLTYKQCQNRWYKKLRYEYANMSSQNQQNNNKSIQLIKLNHDENTKLSRKDLNEFTIRIINLIQENEELQRKYDDLLNKMMDVQRENAKLKEEKEELNQKLKILEKRMEELINSLKHK